MHKLFLPRLDASAIDRWTTLQRLTLELGLAMEKMYLEWLAVAKAQVEKLGAG
jgi:hypothetical protein